MKGRISEVDALALIAEGLGLDMRAAAAEYIEAAHDGDITVDEVHFGPPYGFGIRAIRPERWAIAVILKAGDPRRNADGPIYFLPSGMPAEDEPFGGGRHVDKAEIEKMLMRATPTEKPAAETQRGAPPKVREEVTAWLEKLPIKDKGLSPYKLAASYVADGGRGAVDSVRKIIGAWQNRQKRI